MLKVTRRTDYAIRLLLAMAQVDGAVKAADLSDQTGVSAAFIYKIVQDMGRGGLVYTSTGPEGGMALARPAGDITLLEIFEIMEGPVRVNLCLVNPESCDQIATCPVHPFWERAQNLIRQEMAGCTLETLLADQQALRAAVAAKSRVE